MAVELKRLIGKVKDMDIKLVAGSGGESDPVTWCHMVENEIAADFLSGGELVFVTGIGLEDRKSLGRLICKLYEKKTAGVIINIGPYIDEIPKEVIDFCNEKRYPMYVVPWKIHLAEIMRIISYSITEEEHKEMEVTAAFKNAICFPAEEELYLVPLSENDYQAGWSYCACVIKLLSEKEITHARMRSFRNTLDMIIKHHSMKIELFDYESQLVMVFANLNEDEVLEVVEAINQRIRALLLPTERITLGVGKVTKSIRCLYKSFKHAKAIRKLQDTGMIPEDKYYYGQLGIYRLLIGIDDQEIVEDYYSRVLKPLIDYDEQNQSDLKDVLKCYLDHDGSVNRTAEELFVHRNTINYKLNKVKDILNIDLSSLETRMELMLALALKEIM